jgi:hypothetical protein
MVVTSEIAAVVKEIVETVRAIGTVIELWVIKLKIFFMLEMLIVVSLLSREENIN